MTKLNFQVTIITPEGQDKNRLMDRMEKVIKELFFIPDDTTVVVVSEVIDEHGSTNNAN